MGRSMLDEVRKVAAGWRWTRRPLVPRSAEPWLPDPAAREFPTAWARTPTAKAVREGILRFAFRPLVWSETEPTVEGRDVLDSLRPPVIFVANHASHVDTPLFLCSLPPAWRRKTAVVARGRHRAGLQHVPDRADG